MLVQNLLKITKLDAGSIAFEKEIENGCNLAVIAPQVMHKYDYLSKISNERGIPCVLVDKDIYGPRSGMKLLNMVVKAIG